MRQVHVWRRGVALAAVVALAAACGSSDTAEESPESEAPSTEEASPDATEAAADPSEELTSEAPSSEEGTSGVEGCGEGSVTDPDLLSADREPARCEPGAPAPQPLDEMTTLTVTSATTTTSFLAPIFLGMDQGEFEKENLTLDFTQLGFTDAVPQMQTGQVDIAFGGVEAGLFNAVDQGFDVKMVLGNFFPPDSGNVEVAQTGLWVRRDAFSTPEDPDLGEMQDMSIGSAVGLGSAIIYPLAEVLDQHDVNLGEMDIQKIGGADMMTALANGAIDAAWLLDPFWLEAADAPDEYMLAGVQPPKEPLGGWYFGPRLLDEEPEIGQAFVRAYLRTINTYLDGDYLEDSVVQESLVTHTGQELENLSRTPAIVFDWEIRSNTGPAEQKWFIEFDTVEYDEVIPEEQYVDRSYYMSAVGAS